MAFTQTDLDNIDAAILELATGTKAVRVTINNKTIEYQETSIDQLQKIRAIVQADVGTGATRVYAYNGRR